MTGTINLTETDFAYMAGIIDGEGSFIARLNKDGSFELNLRAGSRDKCLINWIESRWEGATNIAYPCDRPFYEWRLGSSSPKLLKLVTRIIPYLVIKEPQAINFARAVEIAYMRPKTNCRGARIDDNYRLWSTSQSIAIVESQLALQDRYASHTT